MIGNLLIMASTSNTLLVVDVKCSHEQCVNSGSNNK